MLFADRAAIRGGEAAEQLRYCVRFVQTAWLLRTARLQCCCSLCNVLLCRSTLRKVCMGSICLYLRQTIVLCFSSILQLLETQRIPERFYPLHLSKGLGLKREGESPFPFLCFWFLLSHYKRNVLFSFPWKRCKFLPACH